MYKKPNKNAKSADDNLNGRDLILLHCNANDTATIFIVKSANTNTNKKDLKPTSFIKSIARVSNTSLLTDVVTVDCFVAI